MAMKLCAFSRKGIIGFITMDFYAECLGIAILHVQAFSISLHPFPPPKKRLEMITVLKKLFPECFTVKPTLIRNSSFPSYQHFPPFILLSFHFNKRGNTAHHYSSSFPQSTHIFCFSNNVNNILEVKFYLG